VQSKVEYRHIDGFYGLEFILYEFQQFIRNFRGIHLFPAPCADLSRDMLYKKIFIVLVR
jgi:hypothetical protein